MSGFESMSSKYSTLLHPPVDPTDTFDPTFVGITRKRRLEVPLQAAAEAPPHRGKLINHDMLKHDSTVLHQAPQMYAGFDAGNQGPDVVSNRFGQGFQRRHVSTIGTLAHRDVEMQRQQERKEKVAEGNRLRKEEHGSRMNPLTGGPPITGTFQPPPVQTVSASRAKAISCSRSSVFSEAPVENTKSQQLRKERLMNDGLTVTKREWSVKEQMHSFDGFLPPVPKATSSEGKRPLPVPSTRPW